MKQVLTGTCLAAAFAVGLSAQTPQTPPTAQTPQPQTPQTAAAGQDRDAAKTVTVSGCLKAGSSSDSYILSDLKWGGASAASGAVGTSGTAPAAIGSATTLTIKPKGDAKLSEHVGHQVEVSGTVAAADKGASAARPSSPADPAAPPSASAGASASGPAFEARTVKMLSQTCSM
jgi:hypothetical protein